jgi:hypothetical protein
MLYTDFGSRHVPRFYRIGVSGRFFLEEEFDVVPMNLGLLNKDFWTLPLGKGYYLNALIQPTQVMFFLMKWRGDLLKDKGPRSIKSLERMFLSWVWGFSREGSLGSAVVRTQLRRAKDCPLRSLFLRYECPSEVLLRFESLHWRYLELHIPS